MNLRNIFSFILESLLGRGGARKKESSLAPVETSESRISLDL